MYRATASIFSMSRQAGASAVQVGGRLARNRIGVVNESKFRVATSALIQRGFDEVTDAAELAMGPKATVPLIHGAECRMFIEEMIEKPISAKDCGREEIETSDYEEILEERFTKDGGAIPVVKIGQAANAEKDKINSLLNTSKAVVEEGGGARLANPLLLSQTKPGSLNHPKLQWASWTKPTLCLPRTNFWRGVGTERTPVATVHGYHTSRILNSKSEAESQLAGSNPHPHLVTFESAINYFERGPALVAHVPDTSEDLYTTTTT